MYLHRTFINLDRVFMHDITEDREGIQTHELFYSIPRTSDLPNFPSLTIDCMTQNESLASQLTGRIL